MKAKKILFNLSGILKCIASAFAILLFGLVLLLGDAFKQAMLENPEYLDMITKEFSAIESYAGMTPNEILDFAFRIVKGFSVAMIFMGCAGITLAVFNFIFAKKYDSMLKNKTGNKVIFMVVSLLFYVGIASNVLTIIALFLKDERPEVIVEGEK